MRVILAAEGFSASSGVGIERYSNELQERLPGYGIAVRSLGSEPSRKKLALAFNAVTKQPIGVLRALSGVDLVHATDPSSALALPAVNIPTVVTFHDMMAFLLRTAHYGIGDRTFALVCAKVAARCDAIIAVSTQTRREVMEVVGADPSKTRVIHLGASRSFRPMQAIHRETCTVGYVGDITPRKRIDVLMKAFATVKARLPEAKLVVVGKNVAEFLSGEYERMLEMVHQLGLGSAVTFEGRVTEQRLAEVYNSIRVLVLPSTYEGFGLPIIEAESCGTPVVIMKDARIPEEISSSCAKASDASDMADKILRLIQDEGEFIRSSKQALAHSKRFTWEACLEQTVKVYEELVSRR